jgi:hypothetical protein
MIERIEEEWRVEEDSERRKWMKHRNDEAKEEGFC